MNKKDELKAISDDELLVRLSNVLKDSRRVESVIVAHIAEVDARRLFVREASSSMHKYCVDILHLSDAEAFLRIRAARASRPLIYCATLATRARHKNVRCWGLSGHKIQRG